MLKYFNDYNLVPGIRERNRAMQKVFKAFWILPYVLLLIVFISGAASAGKMESWSSIDIGPAQERTLEEMQASETTSASAGKMSPLPDNMMPFLPTMSKVDYNTAKAAAASNAEISRSNIRTNVLLAPPTLIGTDFEGVTQAEAGGFRPPDSHGAIGKTHFVEVTTKHLDIYLRDGTRVKSISLDSFFGYPTQLLFDPRCVYDQIYNRWIITANAYPESNTVQRLFIAVSKTSDPTGSYYIYNIDVNTNDNDDLWDFPQLGMDKTHGACQRRPCRGGSPANPGGT